MTFLAALDSTYFTVDGQALVRLLAAAVLGAAIGIEREASDQPAGLRTHIAVALGAGMFGVISTLGFLNFNAPRASTNIQVDVTRVASMVSAGIGFIGAGVIFREGSSIKNLTTAASLWATAAIGLGCGVGKVGIAATAALTLLLSLVVLRPFRDVIRRRFARTGVSLRIHLVPGADPEAFLDELDRDGAWQVEEHHLEKEAGRMVIEMTLYAHPDQVRQSVSRLSGRPDVETLVWS